MKKMPLAILPLLLASSTAFSAEECGKVTIAEMSWSSATLMASVDNFILRHGYGCDSELLPGDTMATGASMIEKSEPDIAPEMWTNSMKEALEKGVAEKRLRYAGKSLSNGGEEGFWVPAYLVKEDPSLATIEGIRKNAKLFEHPEDPDKSAFYNCPAGWNCQISAGNLFRALKLEDSGFEMIDPGSGAGLSGSIAKAYERKEAWFGYYWSPTSVLGKYEMVKVDFGTGVNEKHHLECITQEECLDPKPGMYPAAEAVTVTTEDFAKRSPEAYKYLASRSYTNKEMNGLLAWMEDNQADGQTVMEYIIEEHEDIWTRWMSPERAAKVKAAL